MASLVTTRCIGLAVVHRPGSAVLAPRVLPQRHCPVHTRHSLGGKIKQSLDFNKKGRLQVIEKLYRNPSKEKLESVLADNFRMGEEGYSRKFTKADYIGLTCGTVLPAIPDFNWGHACSGDVDDDGFCIVTVQATGHHTGAPLAMPGLEPLPPSGKHFCLAEEVQKVKVEGDKVVEIQVLPNKGAGPRALYAALGGKVPSQAAAAAAAAPPLP